MGLRPRTSQHGVFPNATKSNKFHKKSLCYVSERYSPDFLPIICQIETLESLDVSQNHLSSIPNGFITGCRGISRLKLLNFSRNRLEGALPTFTGFGKLVSLDFSHNNLTGKVAVEWIELTQEFEPQL
ncbi:hypothetical protein CQW23_10162 [Capsicum baccatum]|uniref:Uncharacterized protein n=1 Tax=Capsicum baccatum TaxID=33114 RepID=A0A2G2WYX1_CAPBA|nr:hypothetical protein CQW23_10162 [Capsicum baccatum]